MTQEPPPEVTMFLTDLHRQEAAARPLTSYQSALSLFARWFTDTNREPSTAAGVTPTDICDDHAYSITVRSASTRSTLVPIAYRSLPCWGMSNTTATSTHVPCARA